MREFIETFVYRFMNGVNAERVSESKELFDFVLEKIEDIEVIEELGGHSPVWALRA
jgi:hypothetical protein